MYRFRAIAYNDAGPSEPGDPSDPVVIDVPGKLLIYLFSIHLGIFLSILFLSILLYIDTSGFAPSL